MRKIIYFVLMCLYILGAIGGVGYALYNHAYLISIGVVVVAAMALPQVVKFYKLLTE